MSFYDDALFRPVITWPGARTKFPRQSPFGSDWRATMNLLDKELRQLDAKHLVIEVDCDESQIRRDGQPRADARMRSPGVILSFDSRHGPLRYACDAFLVYRDNIRALALGLEALRKVERYGIAARGEQYQGYRALPSGLAIGAREPMSPDEAARVFFDLATDGSWVGVDTPGEVLDRARLHDPDAVLRAIYRGTVKVHHPDRGGSRDAFDALEEAWQVLSTL